MKGALRIKNLKFGTKLALSFIIIMGSIAIYAVYNLYSLYRIHNNEVQVTTYYEYIQNLKDRHIDHLEWTRELAAAIMAEGSQPLTVEKEHTRCAFGQWYYSEKREELEELIPELKSIFTQIENPHQHLHESSKKIGGHLTSGAEKELLNEAFSEGAQVNIIIIGQLLNQAEQIIEHKISALKEYSVTQKVRIAYATFIIGGLVILFGIAIATIIINDTKRAFSMSIDLTRNIAEGDLTQEIAINQKDELGMLASALQVMQAKLQDVIGFINLEAIQFGTISKELSSASMSLSESSNEQASSLEEISSTMEEMNASIEQNSSHAKKTEEISKLSVTGMEEVSERSVKAYEANEVIAHRIEVINDIAFQTNILALNAAVEAARAGEHGRGFAVVAGEVRKLADKSKEAADEILNVVKEGLELTRESMEKLNEILPEVRNTANLLQEISAAGMEQTNGSLQINSALQQLNSITQQSAGASEELASTAQVLEERASQLKNIVAYFKTKQAQNMDDSLAEEEVMELTCAISGNTI
ncbi:MAG TPA: methyl-accepting chemotaxis protein [Marinilabiliaceae bacterium]|nr:methyl-accepting chemotaxis protein [Marinilabiliaceae bacterium]